MSATPRRAILLTSPCSRYEPFKGAIHRMVREALSYIRASLIVETVIKHPDRPEAERFYNYPYEAIEEALVNAVYHRGYEHPGTRRGASSARLRDNLQSARPRSFDPAD